MKLIRISMIWFHKLGGLLSIEFVEPTDCSILYGTNSKRMYYRLQAFCCKLTRYVAQFMKLVKVVQLLRRIPRGDTGRHC